MLTDFNFWVDVAAFAAGGLVAQLIIRNLF